jgi:hypothetical protein
MNSPAAIHIVSPAEFDPGTRQTPGPTPRGYSAGTGHRVGNLGRYFEVEPIAD